jgi:endonuclease YncB( thermonuclease family)
LENPSTLCTGIWTETAKKLLGLSAAKDQYGCAVAKVKSLGFRWNRNADQQLLKAGLAEVYRGGVYIMGWLPKN